MGDDPEGERNDSDTTDSDAERPLPPGADVPVGDHDEDAEQPLPAPSAAGDDAENRDDTDEDGDGEAADGQNEDTENGDSEATGAENGDGELAESDEPFPPGTGQADMSEATPLERKTGGGPATDEELPLAAHIEEMIKRLAVIVGIAGLVSIVVWPFGERVINHLWYAVLPGADAAAPHLYQPLELLITQFKVASLAGLIVALPVFVYETYAFMRPGLYPHERRYYLAAIPTSLVLAVLGVTFAYFVVLPAVFGYFYNYSQYVADIAFALSDTFNLILILMGYLAIVFQIPLFIMLAIMMGLTTRQWLEDRRLLFWGVFLGVSFLFTPDPTGVAPIFVAATMVALFEMTLAVLRWTGR